MTDKPLSVCCSAPKMWEPLHLARQSGESGPIRITFAVVSCCSKCRRVTGDVKPSNVNDPDIKAAAKAFNGTSWAMMLDARKEPPFSFKRGSTGSLVPENYAGELKAQPDFDDEVPF